MDGACTLRNLVKYLKTFSASYTSVILRWLWHVSRTGERCIAFFFGGGELQGNGNLGISRRRWENNIKMDNFMFFLACIIV